MPCLRQKVNDRRKIRLITGNYISSLIELHVSAVLFCFVFSSRPNHAEFRTLKIKKPLLQVKLFKPPVVRETISIIHIMFIPTGAF